MLKLGTQKQDTKTFTAMVDVLENTLIGFQHLEAHAKDSRVSKDKASGRYVAYHKDVKEWTSLCHLLSLLKGSDMPSDRYWTVKRVMNNLKPESSTKYDPYWFPYFGRDPHKAYRERLEWLEQTVMDLQYYYLMALMAKSMAEGVPTGFVNGVYTSVCTIGPKSIRFTGLCSLFNAWMEYASDEDLNHPLRTLAMASNYLYAEKRFQDSAPEHLFDKTEFWFPVEGPKSRDFRLEHMVSILNPFLKKIGYVKLI